jgi:hypothetical protein
VSDASLQLMDDPELASLPVLIDRIRGPPHA